jgi:hypothetical protein
VWVVECGCNAPHCTAASGCLPHPECRAWSAGVTPCTVCLPHSSRVSGVECGRNALHRTPAPPPPECQSRSSRRQAPGWAAPPLPPECWSRNMRLQAPCCTVASLLLSHVTRYTSHVTRHTSHLSVSSPPVVWKRCCACIARTALFACPFDLGVEKSESVGCSGRKSAGHPSLSSPPPDVGVGQRGLKTPLCHTRMSPN